MIDRSDVPLAVRDAILRSIDDRVGPGLGGDYERAWRELDFRSGAPSTRAYLSQLEGRLGVAVQLGDADAARRAVSLAENHVDDLRSFTQAVTTAIFSAMDGDPDFGGTKPDGV